VTRLSVVIPAWNRRELLRACLVSVERALAGLADTEVIVVDDAGTDGGAERVEREFPGVRLLRQRENGGFARAANRGMEEARGELLLLLNSDTELRAEDLRRLLDFLEEHPEYAGAVPRLVGPDGATQRACMAFPSFFTPLFFGTPLERWWPGSPALRRYFLRDFDHLSDRDVEQPPASCWLLRRSAWSRVGAFDERLELFFNDVDWCRRLAAAGGRLRFVADAVVLHHGGASTARREDFVVRWQTDRLRYVAKHHGRAGKVFTKLCVGWTFAAWFTGTALRRLRGRTGEPVGPLSRAFAAFLRA